MKIDVIKRKGAFKNSIYHLKSLTDLRERIETMMGKSIYSLFPEIKINKLYPIKRISYK